MLQAPVGGLEGDLHIGSSLRWNVGPGPAVFMGGVEHGQPYAVPGAAPVVDQIDIHGGASPHKLRVWRDQSHGQAAQCAMANVHPDDGTARQQKSQQIAQIELVVDGGYKQSHQSDR